VNLPLGFRYAAMHAGLRKSAKDDLALIVADAPASAAAVFTQNQVVAAPVVLARQNLKSSRGKAKAWLINAGNANCATRTGAEVAATCVAAAAKALNVKPTEILPASTGVIGVEMDARKVVRALPKLASSLAADQFDAVAHAIMTTDLVPKTAFAQVNGEVSFAGMCKGSGMIQPNMATTLGFVMTDAVASPAELQVALKKAIAVTFNCLTVDGDTSTNDVVSVMASGASGIRISKEALEMALRKVLESLAKQIAADGEGAKKLVTIDVEGAANDVAATKMARAIANSPLVKTAIAGSDPNWGRVIAAAGYAGVKFDQTKVDIYMQGMKVCEGGLAAKFSEAGLTKKLNAPECHVRLVVNGKGKGRARIWTCDFTEGYIKINGSYRT
ncbi:MAG: bifunctional glutamate N-acetyltransferase/amino-acid acetyltransferase ArgJ, partial [Acidobacteriota bacterium]